MVNLDEARFWQESAREWWYLAQDIFHFTGQAAHQIRMSVYAKSSSRDREFMGITDQDQLYA